MDRFIIHSKDQGGKKIRKLSHISHDFFVALKTVKTVKRTQLYQWQQDPKISQCHNVMQAINGRKMQHI